MISPFGKHRKSESNIEKPGLNAKYIELFDEFQNQMNSSKELPDSIVFSWLNKVRSNAMKLDSFYVSLVRSLLPMSPRRDDVEQLSRTLYTNDVYTGLFLSALIEVSLDSEFTFTSASCPDGLGYGLRKKIIIEGDARNFLGLLLGGGEIEVHGNVGKHAFGGAINGKGTVYGKADDYFAVDVRDGIFTAESVGDYAFSNMNGGKGLVNGKAGNYVGSNMEGGAIIVKGKTGKKPGYEKTGGKLSYRKNLMGIPAYRKEI